MVSQFNGTSTPKGSYSAKTGDNDCNVNSNRYSLRTALCESILYQAKSEQNVRQDLIPRVPTDAKMTLNTTRSKIPIFICYNSLLEPQISKKKKKTKNKSSQLFSNYGPILRQVHQTTPNDLEHQQICTSAPGSHISVCFGLHSAGLELQNTFDTSVPK